MKKSRIALIIMPLALASGVFLLMLKYNIYVKRRTHCFTGSTPCIYGSTLNHADGLVLIGHDVFLLHANGVASMSDPDDNAWPIGEIVLVDKRAELVPMDGKIHNDFKFDCKFRRTPNGESFDLPLITSGRDNRTSVNIVFSPARRE